MVRVVMDHGKLYLRLSKSCDSLHASWRHTMLTPALAAVSMMVPILLWRADTCAWIGESVGNTTWFWISPIFTWKVCIVKVP